MSDVAYARAALDRARAAYDDAIARRDAIVDELLPTFGGVVAGHPRFNAARGGVQTDRTMLLA
jgi:hypothetical protein